MDDDASDMTPPRPRDDLGPIGPPQPLPEASDVLGPEGAAAFIEQVKTVWLMPELERRKSLGRLPEKIVLQAFQVLFRGDDYMVRINTEVRFNMTVQATRPIAMGDTADEEDLQHVKFIELVPEELDCAHITMMFIKNRWIIAFNFLLDRVQAGRFVEHAKSFLRVARIGYEEMLVGPAVDCLFSATELACKAHLMLVAHPSGKAKKHNAIHSASNRASRVGRISADFMALHNRLGELRPKARYTVDHTDMLGIVQADLDLVGQELSDLATLCAERER